MKKKLVMLSLALTVILTACSDKGTGTDSMIDTEVEEQVPQETENQENAELTEEKAEEDKAEEVKSEQVQTDYIKGTNSAMGYESKHLGIIFIAPEDFEMASEEVLAQITGSPAENVSGDVSSGQIAENSTTYEMMCTKGNEIASINVITDKIADNITETDYINSFKEHIEMISAMNVTLDDRIEQVQIAGRDFYKILCTVDNEGNNMYQDYYFSRMDGRMLIITAVYTDETKGDRDILLNSFQSI